MMLRPQAGKDYRILAVLEADQQHLVGQIICVLDVFDLTKDLWWDISGIIRGGHLKVSIRAALERHISRPDASQT